MTDFQAGERYVFRNACNNYDTRNGETVTVLEYQHTHVPGRVRAKFEDGVVGAFIPEELTKVEEDDRVTDIKVGDTVRIKESAKGYAIRRVGQEFVVQELRGGPGTGADPYAWDNGENSGGVYLKDLEVVKSVDDPRWRYNDHIVVYPETRDPGYQHGSHTLGRGVTVLDETPLPKIYTRWENQDDSLTRLDDEITAAARAYWAAHPKPKPAWHNPRTNEAWELTVNGDTGPFVVVYNPWGASSREYRFQAGNGTLVDYMSDEITAGRRIYPEPTE